MKVVFIHIPKTAGSSISSLIRREDVKGLWLMEHQLWSMTPEQWIETDILAGHFTLNHLRLLAKHISVDLAAIKLISVIREPFEQIHSNLNHPFELLRRGQTIEEAWMQELLSGPRDSVDHLISVLENNPWLLNMQTEYLRADELRAEVDAFDLLAVFPDIGHVSLFIRAILAVDGKMYPPHLNRSKRFLAREIFYEGALHSYLSENNALDQELYTRMSRARLRTT